MRTLAVVAQPAHARLVASRRREHVVREEQLVLRDSTPARESLDLQQLQSDA
jgi:hypothetical protein